MNIYLIVVVNRYIIIHMHAHLIGSKMSMRGGCGLFYIYSLTHSLVSIIYPHSIIYTHSLSRLLVPLTRRTQPMNIYGIYNLDNDVPSTLTIVSSKLGGRGFFATIEFRWSIYNTNTILIKESSNEGTRCLM